MTRLSVLYVDDDPSNLIAMEYALGEVLDLRTATNGDEALQRAEGVDVLIADQRMPGMSGVEVCRRFRELHPGTTRILYTAYADAEASMAAINEAQVARLLVKPVLNDELLAAIHEAHDERRREPNAGLRALAADARRIAEASVELSIGRSLSELMPALYDDPPSRDDERGLRKLVVGLQSGTAMMPFELAELRHLGIPVESGEGAVWVETRSLLIALVLLQPESIEVRRDASRVRARLRTTSVARDFRRVSSAILERGGAHVVTCDGDLILTLDAESAPPRVTALPSLRSRSIDVLIVGEHSNYSDAFGDLSVAWTDPDGALRRAHDARVVVVDERTHDASVCARLRSAASTLILHAAQPDFGRHRAFAGVIDRLVDDTQSGAERLAILHQCIAVERAFDDERVALIESIHAAAREAHVHGVRTWESVARQMRPLLTRESLRVDWRACDPWVEEREV